MPAAVRRGEASTNDGLWFVLAGATAVIWLAATLLSIFTPRQVTGSDPTEFPVAAVFAPIVAMVLTGFLAGFVATLIRGR